MVVGCSKHAHLRHASVTLKLTNAAIPTCLKLQESKLGQQRLGQVQHIENLSLDLGGQAEDVRIILHVFTTTRFLIHT